MKASLNVFGTCVSNRILIFAVKEKRMDYLIKIRFHRLNPISVIEETPIRCLRNMDLSDRNDISRESFKADANKSVFLELKEHKSDYLLIDLTSLILPLFRIADMNDTSLLTSSLIAETAISTNLVEYEYVDPLDYPERLKEWMTTFCQKILSIYEPEQIILACAKLANTSTNKRGELCRSFSMSLDRFAFVERGYQYFVENIPNCHIIKPLSMMLSAWKTGIFQNADGNGNHYVKECCEYQYESINVITDKLPRDEEQEKLSSLNRLYSDKMQEIYLAGVEKTLDRMRYINAANSYEILWDNKHAEEGNWLDKLREYHGLKSPSHELVGDGTGLLRITNLNEYVDFVKKYGKGYVLFCAVCDSAVFEPAKKGLYDYFRSFSRIGMSKEIGKHMSYLLVYDLDHGKLKEQWDEDKQEVRYRCAVVLDTGEVMDEEKALRQHSPTISIYLSSKGREEDQYTGEIRQWARILIDNIDYAINKRGMNFVLYSKKERCVVDSFYVDSWADESLAIRRN